MSYTASDFDPEAFAKLTEDERDDFLSENYLVSEPYGEETRISTDSGDRIYQGIIPDAPETI